MPNWINRWLNPSRFAMVWVLSPRLEKCSHEFSRASVRSRAKSVARGGLGLVEGESFSRLPPSMRSVMFVFAFDPGRPASIEIYLSLRGFMAEHGVGLFNRPEGSTKPLMRMGDRGNGNKAAGAMAAKKRDTHGTEWK